MAHTSAHERARTRGVNRFVYWIVRTPFQLFFHFYLRMSRVGREHIPRQGPVILAANHRSFFDPFIIGTMTRRPMYYVAKRELFEIHPLVSWILSRLGAFPVDRGRGDQDMVRTAKELLARGEIVLIFPEGHRIRSGAPAKPRRGVGRLALETGAPVIPVAIFGTDRVRRGLLLRPFKARVRAGRALRLPKVESPTPRLATTVTERVWACVVLQWASLGGVVEEEFAAGSELARAA
ncbi:MAG: lysophospholipid acyltransferase family protein [Solirubrobacteraceae bacterium]